MKQFALSMALAALPLFAHGGISDPWVVVPPFVDQYPKVSNAGYLLIAQRLFAPFLVEISQIRCAAYLPPAEAAYVRFKEGNTLPWSASDYWDKWVDLSVTTEKIGHESVTAIASNSLTTNWHNNLSPAIRKVDAQVTVNGKTYKPYGHALQSIPEPAEAELNLGYVYYCR